MRPLVEAGVGGTRVHGRTTALLDVAVGLTLPSSLTVGGAGHFVPASVALGEVAFREVDLELGYGGLFARLERPSLTRPSWHAELLLGAGNADVLDPVNGIQLDSDNFLVVQPAVGLAYRVAGPLLATASVSYRFVAGVEDLRGVEASDLRGASLHVRLRLAPL